MSRELSLPRDRLKLVSVAEGQSIQNETHVRALRSGSEVLALLVGHVASARHPGGSGGLGGVREPASGGGYGSFFGSRGAFGGHSSGRVGRGADAGGGAAAGEAAAAGAKAAGSGAPGADGEMRIGSLDGLGRAMERGGLSGVLGGSATSRAGSSSGAAPGAASGAAPLSGRGARASGEPAGSNVHGLFESRPSGARGSLGSSSRPASAAVDWDDPLRLRLPANAPAWKRRSAAWLLARGVPEAAIVALFAVAKPRAWAIALAWFAGARVAAAHDLGPIYMLATAALLIWRNLGERRPGQASAYSIFNGGRRLPGQLTAQDIDRQFTHRNARND